MFSLPAGALFFYEGLAGLRLGAWTDAFNAWAPRVLYGVTLLLLAHVMRRCRVPAPYLLAFVFPIGFFLQGTLLSRLLPEGIAVAGLLGALALLFGGLPEASMVVLAGTCLVDLALLGPVLGVLWLCHVRAMGFRRALAWAAVCKLAWYGASAPFLLQNARGYLRQACAERAESSWHALIWALAYAKEAYVLSWLDVEFLGRSVLPRMLVLAVLHAVWMQRVWLRGDGGIGAFVRRYGAWQRGHGIRPAPWTPRETMIVVTEALLLACLVRSPSLAAPADFPALTFGFVVVWGVALAHPLPLPAVLGVLALLLFPLSFLLRDLLPALEGDLQLHVHMPRSLHFLPSVVVFVLPLLVLLVVPREFGRSRAASLQGPAGPRYHGPGLAGTLSSTPTTPTTTTATSTTSLMRHVHSREHHQRSISQGRRQGA